MWEREWAYAALALGFWIVLLALRRLKVFAIDSKDILNEQENV
jgi:hypothetical protein